MPPEITEPNFQREIKRKLLTMDGLGVHEVFAFNSLQRAPSGCG
jgi:hypothetical protein